MPTAAAPPMHDYSNSSSTTVTATYAVDPAVASQWSTSSFPSTAIPPPPPAPTVGPPPTTTTTSSSLTPKPDIVKRATSHQNETVETKLGYDGHASVKRATLDRERSLASSRMKDEYNHRHEEKSADAAMSQPARPATLTLEERMSTLDIQALEESMTTTTTNAPKPSHLSHRTSTVEALRLDFDHPDGGGNFLGPSSAGLEDLFQDGGGLLGGDSTTTTTTSSMPKPQSMSSRLTTHDLIDIVNEPFEEV